MLDHCPNVDWPAPYGVMLALACVAGWWLARRRAVAGAVDASHVDLALPIALVIGAGAARLLGAAVPEEPVVAGTTLLAEHRFRLPVIATASLVVLFLYCRAARLSFRRLAEAVAPGALLGIALLRIGCFLAGCCFGDVVEPPGGGVIPWVVRFPAGSFAYRQHAALGLIAPDVSGSLPVYPVQLYESAGALMLCALVLRLRAGRLHPGTGALIAFAGYAAMAFVLQFLRADEVPAAGPLTANQVIYLGWLAAVGLIAIAMRARHYADLD